MKLKDLLEKYGEYEVDSKCIVGECEIERIVIDLTKPRPQSVWDLEDGDPCVYIDAFGKITSGCLWNEAPQDERAREIGNIFLTKKEAEKDTERRKVETLLLKYGGRRWFKKSGENWMLFLDHNNQATRTLATYPHEGAIYFDTHSDACEACDEIGNSRIVKALFEVR